MVLNMRKIARRVPYSTAPTALTALTVLSVWPIR
jgi:hypothetical protein